MPDQYTIAIHHTLASGIILLQCLYIIRMVYIGQLLSYQYKEKLIAVASANESLLMQTRLEVREQTCSQISREIHDHISLSLSLCKLHLNSIDFRRPAELIDKVNVSVHLIGQSIASLNDISKSLDTDYQQTRDIIDLLQIELRRLERTGLFKTGYEVVGQPVSLRKDVELLVLRIVQEALNNIIKHAEASLVTIKLIYVAQRLECNILDNGRGFQVQAAGTRGAGLNNMAKRASMIGADLTVKSEPGKGTLISIVLPL